MQEKQKPGISIIFINLREEFYLDRLISTFLEKNSYYPIEFIIITPSSVKTIEDLVGKYSNDILIKQIFLDKNISLATLKNQAAKEANYPYLLFMTDNIKYKSDLLPLAAAQLENEEVGAVGVRLDDDPDSLPLGAEPGVQHFGIKLCWNDDYQFYIPSRLCLQNSENIKKVTNGFYPAVGGGFLLLRKEDLFSIYGFFEGLNNGFEDVDICLQLFFSKRKKSLCINEVSLYSEKTATEQYSDLKRKKAEIENVRQFKARFKDKIIFEIDNNTDFCKFFCIDTSIKEYVHISVDIIICVHDALDDVKLCLDSVIRNTYNDFHLYLVNDCSGPETKEYLRHFMKNNADRCTLIENEETLGYTKSANIGMKASNGNYLVMLNSDTIVPHRWLDPIISCGESDPQIGVLGPLSNAATYQSVPEVKTSTGDWAINELPQNVTVDEMAIIVAELSECRYPRVPFINGFCYVIKREVINQIGYFDEETFPFGYGEENDYSIRASDKGYSLVIVDNAYVYHGKSKSFKHEKRRKLSKTGRKALDSKHGTSRILNGLVIMEKKLTLFNGLRKRIMKYFNNPEFITRPLKVLWLLIGHGGGGGAHSIVQEAATMNQLPGVYSEVAVKINEMQECLNNYSDFASDLFYFFAIEEELHEKSKNFDVVIATHYSTFPYLERIYEKLNGNILPAYYVQDYEPWIIETKEEVLVKEAKRTYVALPETMLFAKTNWLCKIVEEKHGVKVFKVMPSLDTNLYHISKRKAIPDEQQVHISAMVRPHTPRRAPIKTMMLLKKIKKRFNNQVKISIFGNNPDSKRFKQLPRDFEFNNLGVLKRNEVPHLLAQSDVFIDMSTYQAFGRTAFEAMAVGCAVIVPKEGGVCEFAKHMHNAMIVDTSKNSEPYAAFKIMIDDSSLRKKLAFNAKDVVEYFNLRIAAWSEVELMKQQIENKIVTIIVPVCNALSETIDCLKSLLLNTRGLHKIIVIDDASTDPNVKESLKRFVHPYHHISLVFNEKNLGYTATINKGCLRAHGDVILLNSDTIVTAHWLEKLREAAYSRENIATVTPLSNAAGAFSLPENNKNNLIPAGLNIEQVSKIVEINSHCIRPEVPTGNGFCMYIKRDALDELGLFDEESFPRGYGEENDFCQRAIKSGFINIIDDKTFIYHHRTSSFKESKNNIIAESRKKIDNRWPGYNDAIKKWLSNDPLDPFREQLKVLIKNCQKKDSHNSNVESDYSILYVIHKGKGGTSFTNRDLIKHVSKYYHCYILVTGLNDWSLFYWNNGKETLINKYTFQETWQIDKPLPVERIKVLRDICSLTSPSLVHIRHFLANHPNIVSIFKNYNLPVIKSFHDFYTVCPTIQLVNRDKKYCEGICNTELKDCRLSHTWFKNMPTFNNKYVRDWRKVVAPALLMCDAYVVTSNTTNNVILKHYPFLNEGKFNLIEHGRDLADYQWVSVPPVPGKPVRLVLFGALGPNKGVSLIGEILKANLDVSKMITIDIFGNPVHPKYFGIEPKDYDKCTFHGPYIREELPEILKRIKPSIALIPSLWPETFCHTLTEAWALGLPVIGSNLGAVGERINRLGGGWALDPNDPVAWVDKIADILKTPDEYERRRIEIRNIPFKSAINMANDYINLYRRLIGSEMP